MAFRTKLATKWLTGLAAGLTFASGVGYLAAAYTVSRFLTRPRRRKIQVTPADLDLPFTAQTIRTVDGLELQAWVVEPERPRGTIAMFHGMGHNRQHMLSRIPFLVGAGYRCVVIDHRGHGESQGKQISIGWYEALDVMATAQFIAERWPDQPKIALGISMGASAITMAGRICNWDALVLEGIYPELMIAFRRRIGLNYPTWFGHLYPAVVWFTQKRLHVKISQIKPVQAIREFEATPILFVTGSQDDLAPEEDTRQVERAAGPKAQFLLVPGAGHNDVCEVGGELYQRELLKFMERL